MKFDPRPFFNTLYPIADALLITLLFNVRKLNGIERLRVRGTQSMELPVADNVGLPFTLDIKCSGVTGKDAWVLAQAKGDLMLLLSYTVDARELVMRVIDKAKLPPTPLMAQYEEKSLEEVSRIVQAAVVAVYSRMREHTTWARVERDAYCVDSGPSGSAEEKRRKNNQTGKSIAPSQ